MFSFFSSQNDLTNLKEGYESTMYEYESASNPNLDEIPIERLDENLYLLEEESKIVNFDLSKKLGTEYKATSPNLLASFVSLKKYDKMLIRSKCSSQLFYIISGSGCLKSEYEDYLFSEGDLITMPYCSDGIKLYSDSVDTYIYWVNDSPLLNYLGVVSDKVIIPPTIYKKEEIMLKLDEINNEEGSENRNRNGILLGNSITEKLGTKTLTHILWSLYNVIKPNCVQKPHKHNSVALDLCLFAEPNKVYTLIGKDLDENGEIINPQKVYWSTGGAFTTPPGLWHSHVNESDKDAYVLPVQDAGLYTYQRTLDIQFSK